MKQRWAMYDKFDSPIGWTTPDGESPSEHTLRDHKAVRCVPESELTRNEREDFERAVRDDRTTDGKRRRSAGHGYSGGDGFTNV